MDQKARQEFPGASQRNHAHLCIRRKPLLPRESLPPGSRGTPGLWQGPDQRYQNNPPQSPDGRFCRRQSPDYEGMVSETTKNTNPAPARKVGKDHGGESSRLGRQANENEVGLLQHRKKAHLAQFGAGQETGSMLRIHPRSRNGASFRPAPQR